jgi:hypothetical protein
LGLGSPPEPEEPHEITDGGGYEYDYSLDYQVRHGYL